MKEIPILFSGPMSRAVIEDRKTQTRRVVKPQPETLNKDTVLWSCKGIGGKMATNMAPSMMCRHAPYKPGDVLWVRETWADCNGENGPMIVYRADNHHRFLVDECYPVDYSKFPGAKFTMWGADLLRGAEGHGWRPSIHMPRWACRTRLEVVSVRVERLQDISEEDAIAEGSTPDHYDADMNIVMPFCDLWQSINGPGSWEANPYVWVIEFRRLA